jgi:signal transduction histidine kinase
MAWLRSPRLSVPTWLRPRWTVRLRLTLLYGGLFVVGGAILLAITYALVAPRDPSVFTVTNGGVSIQKTAPALAPPGSGAFLGNGGSIAGAAIAPVPGAAGTPTPAEAKAALQGLLKAQADHERSAQLHSFLIESGVALGLMALVSVVLGWIIAGRVLRPLRTMTATARRMSEDNLGERIALRGPDDELKEMANTFDDLLHRLDIAFEAQRRFVANASHELRTPLTLERAVVEVALADPDADVASLRQMGRHVLATNADHADLIDALLVLARSQRGRGQAEPVNLATVALDVIEDVTPLAAANDVRIEWSLDAAAVTGDRSLLERLVMNLVDNATRYNHRGGWVEVRTRVDAGEATVDITNSGPKVAAEQVGSLFEPFRRLGTDRAGHKGGAGLGLSIVDAVVAAHQGVVRASPREGGGLEVRVALHERRPSRGQAGLPRVTDPVPAL